MIQANELMIGNWLMSAKTNEPFQVTELSINDKVTALPIPLTPEILVRLGFRFIKDNYFLDLGVFDYTYNFNSELKIRKGICSDDITVDIKYLHQLQNLVFALSNEELTLQC